MRNDAKCEITEETHNPVLTEKGVFNLPCINSGENVFSSTIGQKEKIHGSLFQNYTYTKLKRFEL